MMRCMIKPSIISLGSQVPVAWKAEGDVGILCFYECDSMCIGFGREELQKH